MSTCKKCTYCTTCVYNDGANGCLFDPEHEPRYYPMACEAEKPMTNGDRIRIMVNREMMRVVDCPAKIEHSDCINPGLPCPECKRRWLEIPVKEETK